MTDTAFLCDSFGSLLTELLIGRTNAEINWLKAGFRAVYNKELISAVKGELSAKTERMFLCVIFARPGRCFIH